MRWPWRPSSCRGDVRGARSLLAESFAEHGSALLVDFLFGLRARWRGLDRGGLRRERWRLVGASAGALRSRIAGATGLARRGPLPLFEGRRLLRSVISLRLGAPLQLAENRV